MTTDRAELFSALMDREPVDPEALALALDDPEARRALVAFVTLRQALLAPAPGESAFESKSEWRVLEGAHVARPSRPLGRWRVVAAAAVLAAAVGAGMVVERARTREEAPRPTRVVQFEPVPADMKGR